MDPGSIAAAGIELIANTAGETGVKNISFLAFQSSPKTTSLMNPQQPASTRNSRVDAVCFRWRLHLQSPNPNQFWLGFFIARKPRNGAA
jgi:hypothetical protein